jgi:hypothetical protein
VRRLSRALRPLVLVAALLALALPAPAALGATAPYDASAEAGAPSGAPPRLTERAAIAAVLAEPEVADWLERYPRLPVTDGTFDRGSRTWTVHVWSGDAGEVARGVVTDPAGRVTEAWTGPQVAWKMARGRPGAFGGEVLTSWPVWVGLSALFVLGLVDLRRPLSLRTLDLLGLVSFGVSLGFFNRGEVFQSVALSVPPLVYLLVRMAWVGFLPERTRLGARHEDMSGQDAAGFDVRRRGSRLPHWPVWSLAVATLFLLGFRIGLNVEEERRVIDVGYAGVIGADRILDGRAPYGAMPVAENRTPCGDADADGEVRERIQSNGRCESANPRGDTYGPVAYLAYLPSVLAFGWSGKWDALPAAHAAAIAFDLLTLAGLVLVGRRFGGTRLAAVLAFGWVAYPFTTYALLANSNDALMPAALVWGFWLASAPAARGAALAVASWTKFAALLLAPLWLSYRGGLRPRRLAGFALGFAAATALAFSILLLEPSLADAARTFWERTISFQLGRESPFSIWGWGQYEARGIPDLASLQTVVQVGVIVLALAAAVVPREKGPLELAALTAAVLLAFELSLTHWFYLYLPWVLPFVLLAVCLPRRGVRAPEP